MREFYIIVNKEKKGPYSIEELKTKNLSHQDYIWFEGLDNWVKLEKHPDILKNIRLSNDPPPLPKFDNVESNKTEVTGHLKVTKEKVKNEIIEKIKPGQKALKFILIWVTFHLFALLMSYSAVDLFNTNNPPDTSSFWPFVEFVSCSDKFYESEASKQRGRELRRTNPGLTRTLEGVYRTECDFKGVFYQYDWSEFLFFVGGAFFVFVIIRISGNNDEQ